MYLQHQLLDGAQLHLPGDLSHLIYQIPDSGTTSTDGQICPVCPVLSFIILVLHFCNQQAWFLQQQKGQEASHILFASELQERYCQNNRSVNKKFPCHPSYLGFVGKRWERWNTDLYKYLIFHSPGDLELPIFCLTGIKSFSLTQPNQTISVRVLCEVFQVFYVF